MQIISIEDGPVRGMLGVLVGHSQHSPSGPVASGASAVASSSPCMDHFSDDHLGIALAVDDHDPRVLDGIPDDRQALEQRLR